MDNLIKKLGVKLEKDAYTLNAPVTYKELLPQSVPLQSIEDLPDRLEWIQIFCIDKKNLELSIEKIKNKLSFTGQLWVSWPKTSSHIKSDLNSDIVRLAGLSVGLVDVKIASIDSDWSGLKFVYRLRDREK